MRDFLQKLNENTKKSIIKLDLKQSWGTYEYEAWMLISILQHSALKNVIFYDLMQYEIVLTFYIFRETGVNVFVSL